MSGTKKAECIVMQRTDENLVLDPNGTNPIKMKIPNDRSALSILSDDNLIGNGLEYRDDFYIYENNVRIAKWYSYFEGTRIWEPNLDFKNVSKIEAEYQKSLLKIDEHWKNSVWSVVEAILKSKHKKVAYAKPTHKYELYQNKNYWRFNFDDKTSFTWDWVTKPKKLLNHELGQKLYYHTQYSQNTLCLRSSILKKALVLCFDKKLKTIKRKNGLHVQFSINGRDYWYACNYQCSSYLGWTAMSWPDCDTILIKA